MCCCTMSWVKSEGGRAGGKGAYKTRKYPAINLEIILTYPNSCFIHFISHLLYVFIFMFYILHNALVLRFSLILCSLLTQERQRDGRACGLMLKEGWVPLVRASPRQPRRGGQR